MFAEVATLQGLLEGIHLPAEKRDLIRYALEQDGGSLTARLLERLPDREYRSLDDVGEALAPVQPSQPRAEELPREESGLPPGGDDYTEPDTEPGAVRDDTPPDNPPQKTIEEQSKTQKEQKKTQEEQLGPD